MNAQAQTSVIPAQSARRDFMRASGGLALGFCMVPKLLLGMADARAQGANGLTANAWVHITPRGTSLPIRRQADFGLRSASVTSASPSGTRANAAISP